MTVFLFCLAYYLIATKNPLYLALFPVIVLHRETAILLVIVFIMFYYCRMEIRSYSIAVIYQATTWLSIRLILMKIFENAPGMDLHIFIHDVTGVYFQTPAMLSALFIFAGAVAILYSRWSRLFPFVKAGLVLVPIQIILHFILGNPFEFRVLVESFPFVFLAVMICITVPPAERTITQDTQHMISI